MKKLIMGAIFGFALSIVTTAYGSDTIGNETKTDSIEIGTHAGYIYGTKVKGKEYLSVASPSNVQVSGKEVWVNGPLRVNSWDQVSDGDKTLKQELDELHKEIANLKAELEAQ